MSQATATTKDPVCGMTVDPKTAIHAEHNGKKVYFCCDQCRQKFLSDPNAATSKNKSGDCC